jgi:putative ABC transport system substrate-binding protein
MNRRAFVTGLGAVLAAPRAAEAQRSAEPRRLGYLASNTATLTRHLTDAFRQSLRELGWVEGQNIRIEYRFAEGSL